MVLIALAFIGLAAFIGLTVDAGILFIQIGHLRRAVDSSSIAAANQFREGRSLAEIEAAADEFINLNSLNPANAEIFVCDIADPTATNTNTYHDLELCPEDEDGDGIFGPPEDPDDTIPPRKYVRVVATMPVDFTFLPIIGFNSIDIQANAISEAASVDIVLVIDTSESMAYDAECGDGDDDDEWAEINLPLGLGFADGVDDCVSTGGVSGGYPDDYFVDPDLCNDVYPAVAGIQGECMPFEDVRTAALSLLGRLYIPYDRMAVISFDRNAAVALDLSASPSAITSAIGNLTVFKLGGCPGWTAANGYNPSLCTSTNIADGLKAGGSQFGSFLREEAVLILILLSDGSANAATDNSSPPNPICPGSTNVPTWTDPLCKDEDFEIALGDYGYDAEDAAVDQGYFVGCPEANSFDPTTTSCAAPGQGAVVFTIGLGDKLINDDLCDPVAYPGGCEDNQGEKLLRYIAATGDDGDPSTDPCASVAEGLSCGNYYYAPTGAGLIQVFEAIASRIFTRIIH